jgi:hypothetical protein
MYPVVKVDEGWHYIYETDGIDGVDGERARQAREFLELINSGNTLQGTN